MTVFLLVACKESRSPGVSETAPASSAVAVGAGELEIPEDARSAALGVRWLLLAPGAGPVPNLDDQIHAVGTVRRRDGSPASKPPGPHELSFTMYTLPEELREPMRALRAGARARYWLPAAALTRWKPSSWEAADLVLDLEIKEVRVPERKEVRLEGKAPPGLEPKPEPVAPPDAKKTARGYPYLRLIAGQGGVEPRRDARIQLRFSAWRVEGLVVTPVVSDQAASLAFSQVPSDISDVLARMVEGDVVRLWLPPKAAEGLIPGEVRHKAIVDLGLAKIE